MALCALGISQRSGVKNLDSLQHYQQALPSLQKTLQTAQDLSSDGALLTHFILLLYEVIKFLSPLMLRHSLGLDRCS